MFVFPLQVGAARFGLLTLFADQRRDLTHDELERCLAFAELAHFECSFGADAFSLYVHDPVNGWVPTREFQLG